MASYHTFTIKNTFPELELLCAEINDIAKDSRFSEQLIFSLNVCLEEMLTNIIKYGYDDKDLHDIEVRLEIANKIITLTIIDDGHAFNPLEADTPDMKSDVQHRQLGGIGIFLTCKMANKVTYERKEDKNFLQIMLTPHVVAL
jgi:anti-sigma regulatory factor (Ser/Thr protein kinase)